ncbi:hypothetical protein GLAREA_08838 [Glarea lozoyensis ATCC 20868]|uniref:Uncharacterized protein n=1 Tax=Glarea lozoyensis (strain ATCC 20868 / MF5171) TaxID=1116229 RepID=S3DG25_GLAL2|nr:uncharacterized protein GLAREA_08838 [Glarea lozoyensis ATCC 20868]EPE36675.1 hypothetical protein GLAREA_08838 [Glarea lozoyensis ATCC 20868]
MFNKAWLLFNPKAQARVLPTVSKTVLAFPASVYADLGHFMSILLAPYIAARWTRFLVASILATYFNLTGNPMAPGTGNAEAFLSSGAYRYQKPRHWDIAYAAFTLGLSKWRCNVVVCFEVRMLMSIHI